MKKARPLLAAAVGLARLILLANAAQTMVLALLLALAGLAGWRWSWGDMANHFAPLTFVIALAAGCAAAGLADPQTDLHRRGDHPDDPRSAPGARIDPARGGHGRAAGRRSTIARPPPG